MSIIGENMCCNFLHIGKYKKILDGVSVHILPLLASVEAIAGNQTICYIKTKRVNRLEKMNCSHIKQHISKLQAPSHSQSL